MESIVFVMKSIFFQLFLLLIIIGCTPQEKKAEIDSALNHLYTSMDSNYVEAETLLKGLEKDTLYMDESQQMFYLLLKINYCDKGDKSIIPLKNAEILVDYYERTAPHSENMLRSYYYLAGAYRDSHNYPNAVVYYKKAIDLYESGKVHCKDKYIARCYLHLASVYNSSFFAKEAINNTLKYIKHCHSLKRLACEYYNIGVYYFNLKNYKKAVYYYNKAYNMPGLSAIDKADIGQAQVRDFIFLKDTLNVLKRVNDLKIKTNNSAINTDLIYENRANYYEFVHQLDSAIENWKIVYHLRDYLNQQQACGHLFQLYKQKGNLAEAMKYADLYIAYTDTMQHKIESESVARATQLYDYTAYQQKSKQAELDKQKRTTLLVGVILAIVLLATWVIAFLFYKKKQKQVALADATRKNEQLRTCLKAEEKKTETLSQKIDENEAILSKMKENLSNQEGARQQMESEIAEKEALLKSLHQQMQAHLDAENDMQMALNETQKQIRQLEEQLKIEQAFREKLSDRLEEVKGHLLDYEGEMPTAMWKEYAEAFNAKYPNIEPYIMQHLPGCQQFDLQLIYLYCEDFSGKRISMLLNVTMQYINTRKKRIYCKMAGVDKSTSDETRKYFTWLKSIGGTDE